jgi:cobalamin biosynthesis protein CbiD
MEDDQKPPTEDEIAFGAGAWVYCRAHMKPHETGWCGVGNRDKIGLGVKTAQEAIDKCREWGFELYADLRP